MKLKGVLNPETTQEQEFYLKLTDNESIITLDVVDGKGVRQGLGTLIYIVKDTKRIMLCGSIDPSFGFKLY